MYFTHYYERNYSNHESTLPETIPIIRAEGEVAVPLTLTTNLFFQFVFFISVCILPFKLNSESQNPQSITTLS